MKKMILALAFTLVGTSAMNADSFDDTYNFLAKVSSNGTVVFSDFTKLMPSLRDGINKEHGAAGLNAFDSYYKGYFAGSSKDLSLGEIKTFFSLAKEEAAKASKK